MSDGTATPPAPADAAARKPGVGHTIARNSAWLLLDSFYGMAAAFYCSIAVARGLGPDRMGDYNYVLWFASVLRTVTELAIPITFRKFAAELMGREDYDTLKTLVRYALRVQLRLAVVGVGIGLVIALVASSAERRLFATLAVVSVVPALLLSIPTGALQATEKLGGFVMASLCAITVNLVGITLSVIFHWGLLGILVSFLSSRTVDCVLRFILFRRAYARLPGQATGHTIDPALRRRMFTVALRQLPNVAFQILLWERFEVLFLRKLSETRNIAFFSISVTLIQYVMQLPASLGGSAGATLMVQQGRAPRDVVRIASTAIWFTMLISAPALFGVASISDPLLRLVYGERYLAAIPVLMALALWAVPQALQYPLGPFLVATEQQIFILWCGSVQIVISVVGCLLLVPHLGATGAATARGLCHLVGTVVILVFIWRRFGARVPVGRMAKLLVACTAMFFGVRLLGRYLPLSALAALLVGVPVGVAIFALATRWLRYLDEADRERLRQLARILPARTRGAFLELVDFLTPGRAAASAPAPGG